jgi:hypothetical protein
MGATLNPVTWTPQSATDDVRALATAGIGVVLHFAWWVLLIFLVARCSGGCETLGRLMADHLKSSDDAECGPQPAENCRLLLGRSTAGESRRQW